MRRADEADQVFELYRADPAAIRAELEQQFNTLHSRAQVLLGICGVLLTASVLITTGRIIGQGSYELQHLAGLLLASAGLCDISATAFVVGGVLHIRWLTQRPGEDARAWVARLVMYRDRKRSIYHLALGLVMLSMLFYQAAVLIVVLHL